MFDLRQEIQQAKLYAAEYCEGLIGLFQKGESLLAHEYSLAGYPYGQHENDMWRWHNERYVAWKNQQALHSDVRERMDKSAQALLDGGDAKLIQLTEEQQGVVLTARGLLRLHLTSCVQLIDTLDTEERQMSEQEREGLLFQLATSYVMLKIA